MRITVKIKFLGTAAAEGIPAVFCNCPLCTRAKKERGKNIRTRNQILVNGDLIIDFPPDAYSHVLNYGFDMSAVETVLFTHSHADHCHAVEFIYRGAPFAHEMTLPSLNIFGNGTVIDRIKQFTASEISAAVENGLKLKKVAPFETFRAGKYEITALPAAHTPSEDCLIYLIKDGKTAYLQFNDSGMLNSEVYDFLKSRGEKIDSVSFDCTHGYARVGKNRHQGMLDNADERERMQARGIVHKDTKYVITHFSHNCKMTHSELNEKAAELGFITAYDGFEISV